jgi:hypothetical protein
MMDATGQETTKNIRKEVTTSVNAERVPKRVGKEVWELEEAARLAKNPRAARKKPAIETIGCAAANSGGRVSYCLAAQ